VDPNKIEELMHEEMQPNINRQEDDDPNSTLQQGDEIEEEEFFLKKYKKKKHCLMTPSTKSGSRNNQKLHRWMKP
jgi:hypothetical protein